MTRLRKVDPEVLEREYIYDGGNPPISLTELAAKHGLARSGVALKAQRGEWYKRRETFRETIGVSAVERLGEEWVRFETAAREKALAIALDYMNKYAEAMKDPEFKVNTRDFLGVMAMMRTFLGDAASAKSNGEEVLLDADSTDLNPEIARRVLHALEAGEPGIAAATAAASPEVAGED